jgi:broad specificity phosphatase PhoE
MTTGETVLRIILVRHGETDWNSIQRFQGQGGVELNEKGRAQADAIAVALRDEPLKAVYSSPIIRALETAKRINIHHNVSIVERDGLCEMDLGDFDGLLPGELMERDPHFLKQWFEDAASVRMPNGETLSEVQDRAWKVVEEVGDLYKEGTVLMCGHNFVNITILCRILDLSLTHFRRIRQNLAAITIIERNRGTYVLSCMNDTCHLKNVFKDR